MPANIESMFSVRQMPWHREGTILQDYPDTWAEARTAAEMADSPEVRGQAAEALRCLYSAQSHLQQLTNYEPPF